MDARLETLDLIANYASASHYVAKGSVSQSYHQLMHLLLSGLWRVKSNHVLRIDLARNKVQDRGESACS